MILLLDNYDSFTYNLRDRIGVFYPDVRVVRSDTITPDEIGAMQPAAILISPGPGYPKDAGVSVEAVRRFSGKIPILGVCLGHQSVGEAFGGKTVPAERLMHGKASPISIDGGCPLFFGLPDKIRAARYHSLILERGSLPDCLQITALDADGQIMGVRHKTDPTFGVQFHPESVMTPAGDRILYNFLKEVCKLEMKTAAPSIPVEKRVALKPFLAKVVDGENLTEREARDAMDCIMSDQATDSQIAAFITALRMKGETIDEITGFARIMRQKAKLVPMSPAAVDIVGTGGDLSNSFNISTTSAFVAAGAGLRVAKHGNRSVSSKSGAADVLEALGVRISITPEQAAECMERCGMTFLFAQRFHGSMRFAAGPRRETGIRTVFNILGPLSNPAHAEGMLLGVYDEALLEPLAEVLRNLGVKSAMLVHGNDGLDEVSVSDRTAVCEIMDEKLLRYELNPCDYGIGLTKKEEIVGGTAQENAKITLDVLSGQKGPARDIVILNAGCALYVGKLAETIQRGVNLAEHSIDSGAALQKLRELKELTNRFPGDAS
ncbi:bifunctional anthranilate synthase component II/anthranilate phosphoribosyltransferase [Caproicibacter sp.]|uniref:bifunctional anthranilate synthase component II/anthranilate phosphoribosyltransferase n=1 Tax=Caproicibacter sp. TaxID=2814884 RepID=UPI003988B432